MINNAASNNAWKRNETTMLKEKLGPNNEAWWGTQSQPNIHGMKKYGKLCVKNPTPKRDRKKMYKWYVSRDSLKAISTMKPPW